MPDKKRLRTGEKGSGVFFSVVKTAAAAKENPDFSLLSDRQYMPYHKEQTIAYYALFRKNPINEN